MVFRGSSKSSSNMLNEPLLLTLIYRGQQTKLSATTIADLQSWAAPHPFRNHKISLGQPLLEWLIVKVQEQEGTKNLLLPCLFTLQMTLILNHISLIYKFAAVLKCWRSTYMIFRRFWASSCVIVLEILKFLTFASLWFFAFDVGGIVFCVCMISKYLSELWL